MIVIPYMIRDVVASANTALLSQLKIADPNIVGINYQFGPFLEIRTTLAGWTKVDVTAQQKYPLVALVYPFTETHSGTDPGIDSTTQIRLIIARISNPTDKTEVRYIKNFVPILLPITYGLLDAFDSDGRFNVTSPETMDFKKTDYPFYGGETEQDLQKANQFLDFVDAVELKINLTILTPNCQ